MLVEEYKLINTKDGSFTLFNKKFNQAYHNINDGALSEALNKYIYPLFKFYNKKEINVLDICFGLGYNSFSLIYYILKNNLDIKVNIFSPELDKNLIKSLKDFNYPKEFDSIKHIITNISDNFYYKDKNFFIEVKIIDAREYIKNINNIDIIFQDPFSYDVNCSLWSVEYFSDIKKIISNKSLLFTYSIATPVRLSLDKAGFFVYNYPILNKNITIASNYDINLDKIDIKLKRTRTNKTEIYDKDCINN